MLHFRKMHGLGNDFIIIDARENDFMPTAEQVKLLSDRHRGVGCDLIVVIKHSQHFQEIPFLHLINADGSMAEACGNATRCVADLMMREEGTQSVVLETMNGALNCRRADNGLISVEMGVPKWGWRDILLAQEVDTLNLPIELNLNPHAHSDPLPNPPPKRGRGQVAQYNLPPPRRGRESKGGGVEIRPAAINIGNPHCVYFLNASGGQTRYGRKDQAFVLSDIETEQWGRQIETHEIFPEGANVEFVSILAPDHLRMRVWERGCGITQACGSGACAVAAAGILRGLCERKVTVSLDGGDLQIEWPDNKNPIIMTGPVSDVFEGKTNLLT